jgi:hypothetical protein
MTIASVCDTITAKDALFELERILKSRVFSHSMRLCRFLRLTVEYVTAGKADLLKEYLIGCEVYDRRPPYDPGVDSIVRAEVWRLRSKLKQYYDTEGKYNPLRVHFHFGTYVPSFVQLPPKHEMACLTRAAGTGIVDEPEEVRDGMAPFPDLARTTLSAAFAEGLSQEIAQVLIGRGMSCVMEGNCNRSADPSPELVPLNPDFRLEGSIREAEEVSEPCSSATEQLGTRIRQLEKERDNLQKLVCYLLTENECLRQRIQCESEATEEIAHWCAALAVQQ